MAMTVIKKLGATTSDSGKSRISWALLSCSFCGEIVKRTLASKRYLSCGCVQHLHPGCKSRNVKMDHNPRWKGGRQIDKDGYVSIKNPNHQSANYKGYVREHVMICEAVLRRKLSVKNIIHHFNEIKSDNSNANLVICENDEYHKLLHIRADSLRETGSTNNRKCCTCKEWKPPECFYQSKFKNRKSMLCRECVASQNKLRKENRNAQANI